MRFLCPVSGDGKYVIGIFVLDVIPLLVDPLIAFAFVQTFIEILYEYFGTVSAATLRDNFDVVYQVCSSRSFVYMYD